MSLTLSLCQYILRPRPGLGQALLGAPRLQALATFHQHNRNGKIVMIKTSRYIRLVMGSFLAPETDMIFEDGVGASLVRNPYCEHGVGLCVGLWCDVDAFRAAEEDTWGKTRHPRHRIQFVEVQFWTSVQRKRVLKRGQKVDPLEIKSGSAWRVQFWPLHCDKSIKTFISSWSWFHQHSCG